MKVKYKSFEKINDTAQNILVFTRETNTSIVSYFMDALK